MVVCLPMTHAMNRVCDKGIITEFKGEGESKQQNSD